MDKKKEKVSNENAPKGKEKKGRKPTATTSTAQSKPMTSVYRGKPFDLKFVATKSAAILVADLARTEPALPGLNRQPKTPALIAKQQRQRDQPGDADESKLDIIHSDVLIHDGPPSVEEVTEKSKVEVNASGTEQTVVKDSESRNAVSSAPSTAPEIRLIKKPGKMDDGSGSGSDGEHGGEDPGSPMSASQTEFLEREPSYEMANVDIDVTEAQSEIDGLLKALVDQGRLTEREKLSFADKFDLFLQALINFQEREVELIEDYRMKTNILDTIEDFARTEHEITMTEMIEGETEVKTEEEKLQEEVEKMTAGERSAVGAKSETDKHTEDKKQKLAIEEMPAPLIRQTLLSQLNKLELQKNMKGLHRVELKQLEYEKAVLHMQYNKMVKPTELNKELKELKKTVKDLEMNVTGIINEMNQLQIDIANEERGLLEDEAAVNAIELELLTKQMEVSSLNSRPAYMARETDKDTVYLQQLTDDVSNLNIALFEKMSIQSEVQAQVDKITAEHNAYIREEARYIQARKISDRESDLIVNHLENLIAKEQSVIAKIARADTKLTEANKTRRKLIEDVHIGAKDVARMGREFKKLERICHIGAESNLNHKIAADKMRSAYESSKPDDSSRSWEKVFSIFTTEISNLKSSLNKKIEEGVLEGNLVQELQRNLNQLFDFQLAAGKDLQELIRTVYRKRREREEKSEQCLKLENQLTRLVHDKKMQEIVLTDMERHERDIHRTMEEIRIKYNAIKIERSGLINDVLMARQKILEQSDKIKIGQSEINGAQSQLKEREAELHKSRFLASNASMSRNSARNEALKKSEKFKKYKFRKQDLQLHNKTLRLELSTQIDEIDRIRESFGYWVKQGNKSAMRLRERIEEICTFIEANKILSTIVLNGYKELRMREFERIELLTFQTAAIKHILVVQSQNPRERNIIAEVEKLRAEFYVVAEERIKLENKINEFDDPNRLRLLNFDWLKTREVKSKIDQKIDDMEVVLANRMMLDLERELIAKQVVHLKDTLIKKYHYIKTLYGKDAREVSNLKKHLREISFKIDGLICEVALSQTRAKTTESTYFKMKQELEEAETRFESGFSPMKKLEEEWLHIQWRNKWMNKARQNLTDKFLVEKNRPKGSQIIMERLRPKNKSHIGENREQRFLPDIIPITECQKPRFPYFRKPSKRASVQCMPPGINEPRFVR